MRKENASSVILHRVAYDVGGTNSGWSIANFSTSEDADVSTHSNSQGGVKTVTLSARTVRMYSVYSSIKVLVEERNKS
jgi:hypothetical protein